MTRKQVQKDGTPVFDLTLRYESTYFDYFDPQYGGNISEILWSRDEPYSYGYAFDYDAHSRVTDALYMYDENNIPGCCSEEGITYDKNGNLLTLYRYDDNGEIADIRNTYSGNHLTGNTYDAAGNVTCDSSSGLSYQWNHLNLIKNISEPDMCLVNYSYLADGTKLSSLDDDGDGLLYRGSLIYRKTDGEVELESILFEGGRFVPNGGPMLHVTDHLGSVRAVVNALSGEVTETSDYFPFGMRMDIWGAVEDESNRYRFNGKEDQEGEFGVPTLDYGARHYSATSARWLSMDPLAEKYYSVSPYAFCSNNPINRYDPNGKWDIKVSAMDDRGSAPYASMTVTNRSGETIYKTVVKVRGNHRNRSQTNGDTPIGEYKIDEWRQTGTRRYPADAYGPNELLALIYLGEEGTGRSGIHLHGGRNQMELSNTLGCIRIADEDIAELKVLTEALEASNPEESKGRLIVENDLIEDIKYQDREPVKYDWERYMGKLNAAVVIADN